MATFDKPALSITQQLHVLEKRGLRISEPDRALHYLSNVSYYRWSAYTKPFYGFESADHVFLKGTDFEDVIALYIFDRELRLLLLDAIERIEISLRAQLANTLAEHHGPHGYLDASVFDTRYDHAWLLNRLLQLVRARDAESFLRHYRDKYTAGPSHPPIWMALELLTFKEVSILFANLRQSRDVQSIETHFRFKFPVLRSWFRSLSDLRNVCAHHARVWNREFGSRPEMPRKAPGHWPSVPHTIKTGSLAHPEQTLDPRRRVYCQLLVIETLMQIVCPESAWANRLFNLLDRYPSVSRPHMGFPPNWEKESLWGRSTV